MRSEVIMLCKEIGEMLPKNYPLYLDTEANVLHVVGFENDYGNDVLLHLPDYTLDDCNVYGLEVEANRSEDKSEFEGLRRIRY